MAKTDFNKDLPKLQKRVGNLVNGVKKLGTMHKKKYAEFETVNGALWEGKDMVEDNKKKLKKEKDTKKIKVLAEEIDAQETTFKKMSSKVTPIRKDLADMSSTAGNLKRSLQDEKKTIDGMQKELKRMAGDLKTLKEWNKTLVDLADEVSKSSENASLIADTGLANTPKL